MNAKSLAISLIVSVVIALVAVVVHDFIESRSFDLLGAADHAALVLQFAIAIFAGHLIIQLGENYTAGGSDAELGTVKWFNTKKGYGFITRDQGDDVFVHFRNIRGSGRRSITEGNRVRFTVISGEKGLQADDVHEI